MPAGAELESRIPIPSSQLSRRYIYIFIYIYRFRVPLPRSSPCRKQLFSCQGAVEKKPLKYSEFRGGKIQPCSETFLLCAQWAQIYGSTCGPVGPKFPPTGLEVAFTYSEFRRGQSQPSRENILTPVVSKFGGPLGPGSLCDHWSGSSGTVARRATITPTLYIPHGFGRKTNPHFRKKLRFFRDVRCIRHPTNFCSEKVRF